MRGHIFVFFWCLGDFVCVPCRLLSSFHHFGCNGCGKSLLQVVMICPPLTFFFQFDGLEMKCLNNTIFITVKRMKFFADNKLIRCQLQYRSIVERQKIVIYRNISHRYHNDIT